MITWDQYEKMLLEQIKEAKINVEYAETQLKQARVKHEIAVRGLESFRKLLEEKLEELDK